MNYRYLWLFLLLSLAAPLARAQTPVLLGEREALLGNTGIGRLGSSAAGYYNPAGLVAVTQTKISASGSLFQQSQQKSTGAVSLYNESFDSIPAHFANVGRWGDWRWAFSVFNPEKFDHTLGIISDLGGLGRVPQRWKVSGSVLMVGPSLSYRINDRWRLGTSLFGIKDDRFTSAIIRTSTNSAGTVSQQLLHLEIQSASYSLQPLLGVHYQTTERLSFGLRMLVPMIPLNGSQRLLMQGVGYSDTGGTVTDASMPEVRLKTNTNLYRPLEVGAGFLARFGACWTWSGDVNFMFKDARASEAVRDSFSVSSGLEYGDDNVWTLGSFYKNNAAQSTLGSAASFYGLSVGRVINGKYGDTGYGVYYIFGGENENGVKNRMNTVGVLLTTSFRFD